MSKTQRPDDAVAEPEQPSAALGDSMLARLSTGCYEPTTIRLRPRQLADITGRPEALFREPYPKALAPPADVALAVPVYWWAP